MRTLHVDCSQSQFAGPRCPELAKGTVNVTVPKSCCSCLVPYSFPIMRRCCLCLLNLPCWLQIKIMFVPKLAVPHRKKLDRVKVNLAPRLVRVKTKAYSAQSSIFIVRFPTEFRSEPVETKIEIVHIYFINFRKKKVTCMHKPTKQSLGRI